MRKWTRLSAILFAGLLLAQPYPETLFRDMKWRNIGPFRGGRVITVAGVPSSPTTFYFGAVAGGVWKTTDGGNSWIPLFDRQPISSIGSLAVADADPNILYVGTGEACIRGNISHGDGVYKSLDGGKTWAHIGLRDTRHIGKVIVHPRNADIVFVAALGHAYGPNAERGVFRSNDGGKTWEKVLYKDEKTGAVDITFDPANPRTLFATLWEASRNAYNLSSGGPGSGLYKSTDGGTTWRRLGGENSGLPTGILGRIGVSVSGADSNRVYAVVEAAEGGLFRSENGGEAWKKINDDHRLVERSWYYAHVFADPKAADTVYVLNVGMYRSVDGGKSLTTIQAPHGDHHALWIDPRDPLRMINGNDGGATVTFDGGRNWTTQDNQPTAQFYHVAVDNRFPYYVYGAQQDNSTVAIASRGQGSIQRTDWYPAGGGESGFVVPKPDNPEIIYAGSYGGLITRLDRRTGQQQAINPWPDNPMGYGADALKHRFQWTSPILVSQHDPNVVYHAAEVLFKSTNGGASWTQVSGDLTRNDKNTMGSSGGPINKDNTSVEYYGTIFALAESPLKKDLLWAGSDDGRVHVTSNGGKNWTEITPKEMPEWSLISLIDPSPHDANTAYMAVDRHKLDDPKPYIYRTKDLGKTWTAIAAGIPERTFVHAVREDPQRKGLLYAGTEIGVFVSFDDGAHWQALQLNLPTSPVNDLVVKNDELVVATHGRSFWILDDLTPLRQVNAEVAGADAHLYKPERAYRTRLGGFGGGGGGGRRGGSAVGENPPDGAIIDYYLKSPAKDEITLEILDAAGKPIRKFSSVEKKEAAADPEEADQLEARARREKLPAAAGMHRYTWDLRYDAPSRVPGVALWGGNPRGSLVVPGTYQAKLTAAGKTLTAPFEVKLDPRVDTSQPELQRQSDLMLKIHARVTQAHDAVKAIRELRAQLQDLKKRATSATLKASIDDLDKKMTAVEGELTQVRSKSSEDPLNYPIMVDNKLTLLGNVVESADTAPTAQSLEVYALLDKQLDGILARWNDIQSKDLKTLNEAVRKENVPALTAK